MRVAIVGGKLQGVEAAYLAKKAGWEVVVVDKKPKALASEICDQYYSLDVTRIIEWIRFLKRIDLVIPALENKEVLNSLVLTTKYAGVPLLFDPHSYAISSSKIISNEMFIHIGIPAPAPWPNCDFPVIIKPSGASGSQGVLKIKNHREFQRLQAEQAAAEWVVEEYLEGPSYSLEVIGYAGTYKALQITELNMDSSYDCKRVIGSANLSDEIREQFEKIGLRLASYLKLNGIMDVEVILHQDQLKVLEIDARIPSQTPTAVYHATGINILEIIGQAFVSGKVWDEFDITNKRDVIYEHIHIFDDQLEISGEHIMANAGPLQLCAPFFGADEALTNYSKGKTDWVATLIITGVNRQEAWKKRDDVIKKIRRSCQSQYYFDRYPGLEDDGKFIRSV
ncbi:3-methylornithine--L-lysine ligase PylC [Sporomusa sp. KB1]|jgi:pyrrolysine biosynthesis protein PylC|uniref:3-methylornithine--L-lysine ligase PylC n=1 Tax=Sporomusa sp. KB1 TaxID=943346 RepID=UPI00119D2BE4|nr:3-methylornithine--L-lysine ligase PylC [Sporomusa sp. KB1]TWH45123.1 pyrrolysine biosynthesis protein PylC [Sporomusa sp. KB1]